MTSSSPLVFSVALVLWSVVAQASDPPRFDYDPERARTGVAYHYAKSNIDGSHASLVSVYRPDDRRIVSLKYDGSGGWATRVEASMDWETFTVSSFRTTVLRPGQEPQLRVDVRIAPDGRFSGMLGDGTPISGVIEPSHWHSYDFDLASLGTVMPHLSDPERSFTVSLGDPGPGPELPVDVDYVGRESYAGRAGRRYTIDGPGLQHRGGVLWTDLEHGDLLGFEIDLPDEDGYDSNKLELLEVEVLPAERWECLEQNRGQREACEAG